jgi:hypothetical protein
MLFALPCLLCVVCYMPLGLMGVWLNPSSGDPPWLTTLITFAIAIPVLLFGFGPWLLSGHYWLTTQHLVWQPRSGKPIQLPVGTIRVDRIRYFPWTQGLQIKGERSVILRFVAGLDRLWGGILLLQVPGLAVAIENAPTNQESQEAAIIRSATCSSLSGRTGIAVLTRTYIAFIPAQLEDYSAEIFVEAIFSALAHGHPRTIHPELPLENILGQLAGLAPEVFQTHLQRLATTYGGVFWRNGLATTVESRSLPAANGATLNFKNANSTLRCSILSAQMSFVERILIAWAVQAQ